MDISIEQVKELREATGAGILDCRNALEITEGDFDKAVEHLREKGIAEAAKRMSREANEGLVASYIHGEGRIGVLVEVNCETDFVARTDEFEQLVNNIAMQIAAMAPLYITRDDVPEEVIEREKGIYRTQALEQGKPEHVIDRIVAGRLEKFYQQACLMEQEFIRNDEITVEELLKNEISTIGENIVVRRFVRFERGESLEA
jgi:elongation factor Ts